MKFLFEYNIETFNKIGSSSDKMFKWRLLKKSSQKILYVLNKGPCQMSQTLLSYMSIGTQNNFKPLHISTPYYTDVRCFLYKCPLQYKHPVWRTGPRRFSPPGKIRHSLPLPFPRTTWSFTFHYIDVPSSQHSAFRSSLHFRTVQPAYAN